MISLLNPSCGKIYSSPQFESKASTSQSRKEAAESQNEAGDGKAATHDEDGLPNMVQLPDTKISFAPFPKRMYPENSTPEEISRHSMDHSWLLEKIIRERYTAEDSKKDASNGSESSNEDSFLGELQYAFVVFLIGQEYDSFEQWKRIVSLFCKSETAASNRTALFQSFIKTMYYQIQEIPADFFVDITDSKNNFLVANLGTLLMNCESSGQDALCERARKFKKHLESKYEWEFSLEEDDEDAPVVVELGD